MEFKLRLKQLREENKLTQKELSDKLNISRYSITGWENGTREPNLDKLIKLAEIFDCTIDYLLGYSNIKKYAKSENFSIFINKAEKNNITLEELNDVLDFIYKFRK